MEIRSVRRGVTILAATTVALGALVTSALAATSSDSTTRSEQEGSVPAIATMWAAAWNGTDPQALSKLFTANGAYIDLAALATMEGTAQIAGWKSATDMLIGNVHITVAEAFRSGDHVAIETVYAGQIHGAPHAFAVPATTILEMDGKLIASDRDYYSLATLLKQSGLPADWTPTSP
jgi:ketosteroid isomerase-like protein